jgi:uncharacterized damage-inducible protein DinB
MDQAFDGDIGESLLGNLASVPREHWQWTPQGGNRTVMAIVQHIGECKYVYDNHAFGDQSMRWSQPDTMPKIAESTSAEEVFDWLRTGHQQLRGHVAALDDDSELLRLRYGWSLSDPLETRKILTIMITHDSYHAGEINHIRALLQETDLWPYQMLEPE